MSRSQNRNYKKDAPHKDARLFLIVAEGEREDAYFNFFANKSRRVKIKIVPRNGNNSSPNDFLNRIDKFQQQLDMEPSKSRHEGTGKYDFLWFVLDVDKWQRSQIEDIQQKCMDVTNWDMAISNPCFEIWLYNHLADVPGNLTNARQVKRALDNLVPGGYNVDWFAPKMEQAMERSREADANNHYYPDLRKTKVYLLAEALLAFLGKNWNH